MILAHIYIYIYIHTHNCSYLCKGRFRACRRGLARRLRVRRQVQIAKTLNSSALSVFGCGTAPPCAAPGTRDVSAGASRGRSRAPVTSARSCGAFPGVVRKRQGCRRGVRAAAHCFEARKRCPLSEGGSRQESAWVKPPRISRFVLCGSGVERDRGQGPAFSFGLVGAALVVCANESRKGRRAPRTHPRLPSITTPLVTPFCSRVIWGDLFDEVPLRCFPDVDSSSDIWGCELWSAHLASS